MLKTWCSDGRTGGERRRVKCGLPARATVTAKGATRCRGEGEGTEAAAATATARWAGI